MKNAILSQAPAGRRVSVLLSSLALAVLILGCDRPGSDNAPNAGEPSDSAKRSAAGPVTIPAILPLTGPSADLGRSVANGMRLAAEDLNANRPAAAFNLRIDDSKGKPTDAVTAYRAAPPSANAGTALSWMSSVGNALAPVAVRDSVALFVGAALPSLSSPTGLVVRVWPRAQHIGERMGEYAVSQRLQTIAVLFIDDEYGRSVADAFANVVQRGGIQVVAREPLAVGSTDFRVNLERVKRLNPRAIYMPAYGAVYVNGLKQIRQVLGDSVLVMADLPLLSAFTLPQFGDELENVVVTATVLDIQPYQTRAAQAFADRYRARFGHNADFNAGLGYMMFAIAARAIEGSNGSGPGVAAYISRTGTFDGPVGPIRFDALNDCDLPMQIAQFQGGRLRPLTPLRRADGSAIPGAQTVTAR